MSLPKFVAACLRRWPRRLWLPALLALPVLAAEPPPLHPHDREGLRQLGSSWRLRFHDRRREPGYPDTVTTARLVDLLVDPDPDVALGAAVDLRQWRGNDQSISARMRDLSAAFQRTSDHALRVQLWGFLIDTHLPDLTTEGRDAVVANLRQALTDSVAFEATDDTAVASVRGLAHVGLRSPEVAALLRRLANSEGRSIELRRVAAWGAAVSLVQPLQPDEVAALQARLRDGAQDPLLRRYAARALAAQRDPVAIDALLACLKDGHRGVRTSCRLALLWLVRSQPSEPRLLTHLHARLAEQLAERPAATADAVTLGLHLVLADDSRMPLATALPIALRLLSHESLGVASLAGGWLWQLANDAEPMATLEALGAWFARQQAGHRASPVVAGLMFQVLSRLPEPQLQNLPERLWQPAREAARTLAQQLAANVVQDGVDTLLPIDSDRQFWESGPVRYLTRALSSPEAQLPDAQASAPRALVTAAAPGPKLGSQDEWREWTLPSLSESRFGPGQLQGSGQLAFSLDRAFVESFSQRLDAALERAGDTPIAQARKLVRENPLVAAGLLLLAAVAVCGHLVCGLYFLASRRPWRLADAGVRLRQLFDRRSQVGIFGLQVRLPALLAGLSGLWWCQFHPKVLDGWVARHRVALRDRFEAMPTVASRRQVLDRPVEIDGRRSAGMPGPTELRALLGLDQPEGGSLAQVLVIHGDGGSGKTTLACQIAALAWAEQPAARLAPGHHIVPVLIERDWVETPMEPAALVLRLVERVREELSVMAGGRVRIDRSLVEAQLRRRRLLVILDHLSEMGEPARAILRQVDRPDFVAPLLLLTSRRREEVRDAHHLRTPLLRGEAAAAEYYWHFLRAEHEARHGDALSDARYHRAEQCLRQLSAIIRERQVSILLVRLYAAYAVTTLDDDAPAPVGQAPRSVPQVMQWHVQHAVRDAELAAGAVRVDTLADAKVVAWACLQGHWVPGKAGKRALLADLAAVATQPPPAERLEWLRTKANLVRQDFGDTDEVAFVLDPLAEYMAAFHLVDDARTPNAPLLRQHGETIAALDPATHGFRAAVDDCFADKLGVTLADALARRALTP